MSGLAAVLAARHEPGVFRWHAAFEATEVGHAVEHAGWRFGHLDAWPTDSKAEFLERVGPALGFPDTFGKTLDALADSLSDIGSDGVGTVLLWDGWGPFAHTDEAGFADVMKVLNARAVDESRGPFVVLLRGDGPELPAVTSLD